MRLSFITERQVSECILEHIGELKSRTPQGAVSSPPSDAAMQQRNDRGTRRPLNRDPPVDVMPDLKKPESGSGQVRPNPPT